MMDSVVAWHPSLADESRNGFSRPLGVTPAARRTRRAHAAFQFAVQPGASVVRCLGIDPLQGAGEMDEGKGVVRGLLVAGGNAP